MSEQLSRRRSSASSVATSQSSTPSGELGDSILGSGWGLTDMSFIRGGVAGTWV